VGARERRDGEPEINPFPLRMDKEGLVALIVQGGFYSLPFDAIDHLLELWEEVVGGDISQSLSIHIEYFFSGSIQKIDLPFRIDGQESAIEALNNIPIEGFKLVIVILLLDQLAPFPFQFLGDYTAEEGHNIKSSHVKNERIEELARFKNAGGLSDRMNHPIVLKEEEKSIEQGRKRGREKSSAFEEDDATPNDGEDIRHREEAVFPAGEENESNNEEMIEHHLNESESTEILDGPEQDIV
jgi:hypothetical protein